MIMNYQAWQNSIYQSFKSSGNNLLLTYLLLILSILKCWQHFKGDFIGY